MVPITQSLPYLQCRCQSKTNTNALNEMLKRVQKHDKKKYVIPNLFRNLEFGDDNELIAFVIVDPFYFKSLLLHPHDKHVKFSTEELVFGVLFQTDMRDPSGLLVPFRKGRRRHPESQYSRRRALGLWPRTLGEF
jgi:hypothetical protein